MATEDDSDVPATGAVFTFGLCKLNEDLPTKFWVRDDAVVQVSCGEEHTSLVTASGRVFAFGRNEWGQLGLGHKKKQNMPACLKSLKTIGEKVTHVACGRTHTILATKSMKIFAFGANGDDQLGVISEGSERPIEVEGLPHVQYTMLSAGGAFSAAVTADGALYIWGSNSEGQLGVGMDQLESSPEPRTVSLPGKVSYVSCGNYHIGAVLDDGRLFMWGEADDGKLGLSESVIENQYSPCHVTGINEPLEAVACGNSHTLALSKNGVVYAWGSGPNGEMGLGSRCLASSLPQKVASLEDTRVISIAAGECHSALICDRGYLYTFGDGRHGKLGLGDEDHCVNQLRPFRVKRLSTTMKVEKVACGGCQTLALVRPRTQQAIYAEAQTLHSSIHQNGFSSENTINGHLSDRGNANEESADDPMDALAAKSIRPVKAGFDRSQMSGSFKARYKRHDLQENNASLRLTQTLPAMGNLSASLQQPSLPVLRRPPGKENALGIGGAGEVIQKDRTTAVHTAASELPKPTPRVRFRVLQAEAPSHFSNEVKAEDIEKDSETERAERIEAVAKLLANDLEVSGGEDSADENTMIVKSSAEEVEDEEIMDDHEGMTKEEVSLTKSASQDILGSKDSESMHEMDEEELQIRKNVSEEMQATLKADSPLASAESDDDGEKAEKKKKKKKKKDKKDKDKKKKKSDDEDDEDSEGKKEKKKKKKKKDKDRSDEESDDKKKKKKKKKKEKDKSDDENSDDEKKKKKKKKKKDKDKSDDENSDEEKKKKKKKKDKDKSDDEKSDEEKKKKKKKKDKDKSEDENTDDEKEKKKKENKDGSDNDGDRKMVEKSQDKTLKPPTQKIKRLSWHDEQESQSAAVVEEMMEQKVQSQESAPPLQSALPAVAPIVDDDKDSGAEDESIEEEEEALEPVQKPQAKLAVKTETEESQKVVGDVRPSPRQLPKKQLDVEEDEDGESEEESEDEPPKVQTKEDSKPRPLPKQRQLPKKPNSEDAKDSENEELEEKDPDDDEDTKKDDGSAKEENDGNEVKENGDNAENAEVATEKKVSVGCTPASKSCRIL